MTGSTGSVYIFYQDVGGTDNWGEVRKLQAKDGQIGNDFGGAVAVTVDGLAVFIGAEDYDTVGLYLLC